MIDTAYGIEIHMKKKFAFYTILYCLNMHGKQTTENSSNHLEQQFPTWDFGSQLGLGLHGNPAEISENNASNGRNHKMIEITM